MPLLSKSPATPSAPLPPATLDDPASGRRRQAIRELSSQIGTAALLADRLPCEQDASVRHALLGALADHPDRSADLTLAICLRSMDAAVRNGAIDALRSNPLRRCRIAEALLDDPDPDVRISALTLLDDAAAAGTIDLAATLARVQAMLETEPDLNVCGAALGLLEAIAGDGSLPVVQRLRCRFADEPYLQFACARVIQRLNDAAPR